MAPLPASITRYCTPLGSDCTPALALLAARNWVLLVLFSAAALSYSALAACARPCSRFWKASTAGFNCSAVIDGCFLA
ncbi:hypothetical protein D3C85_1815290 [compost metagenome]